MLYHRHAFMLPSVYKSHAHPHTFKRFKGPISDPGLPDIVKVSTFTVAEIHHITLVFDNSNGLPKKNNPHKYTQFRRCQ